MGVRYGPSCILTSMARVQSADRVGTIGRRDVACVVIPEVEASKFTSTPLERLRTILVPGDLFAKILTSGPPRYLEHSPPFGGHILFTSGGTMHLQKGIFKWALRGQEKCGAGTGVPIEQERDLPDRQSRPVEFDWLQDAFGGVAYRWLRCHRYQARSVEQLFFTMRLIYRF